MGMKIEFGALRLFRWWRMYPEKGPELHAIVSHHIWQPGNNVATSTPDEVGGGSHGHGFFGWYYLQSAEKQEVDQYQALVNGRYDTWGWVKDEVRERDPDRWVTVFGTSLHYGRVMDATEGARSHQATPESVILSGNAVWDYSLYQVAKHYNMKTMTLAEAKRIECGIIPATTKDLGLE